MVMWIEEVNMTSCFWEEVGSGGSSVGLKMLKINQIEIYIAIVLKSHAITISISYFTFL